MVWELGEEELQKENFPGQGNEHLSRQPKRRTHHQLFSRKIKHYCVRYSLIFFFSFACANCSTVLWM